VGASFFIAGQLGPVLGWRTVFIVLGLIGVGLSAIVLTLRDSDAKTPGTHAQPPRSSRAILLDLAQEMRTNSDFRLSLAGAVLMHVYLAGNPFVKIWLVEERGYRGDEIASTYGLAVIVFGLLGAAFGGVASDWYARRYAGGRAMFLALFVAVLSPFIIAFRFADPGSLLFYAGMGAGILFFSAFYGASKIARLCNGPLNALGECAGFGIGRIGHWDGERCFNKTWQRFCPDGPAICGRLTGPSNHPLLCDYWPAGTIGQMRKSCSVPLTLRRK
jgi:MFS family permease